MHPNWRKICDDCLKATSYDPAEMEEGWKGRKYDHKNCPPTYLAYPNAKVRIPLSDKATVTIDAVSGEVLKVDIHKYRE